MASQLDTAFFRKAKKVDRAIEIFDHEAVIPAVKERAEIRVKLPVRRLKTIEERTAFIQENIGKIELLDGEIEQERKNLLDLVKVYRATRSGGSDVVATNLKVKGLMERRSTLVSPDRWIEEIPGLSFKDVFASKRDVRKIGASVYQIKRRTEPIESLYVNLVSSEQEVPEGKEEPDMPPAPASSDSPVGKKVKTTAEVAQGAIIGQRKVIKVKKAAASLPASGATFST
jgi:hypothetical protein